jgi:hypothetical protein
MAAPIRDITGMRFGRLIAIEPTPRRRRRMMLWRFQCDCGNEHEAVSADALRGGTNSCGCLRRELGSKFGQKYSAILNARGASVTHGMTNTREFSSWTSMTQRVCNPNHKSFDDYGGRGITICERWLGSFENFYADMGDRPLGLTLERINNNGNYEPTNCEWATSKKQANNRRSNRPITLNGRTRNLNEWASDAGIHRSLISNRIDRGWSVEDAVSTAPDPANAYKRGVR